MLRKRYDRMNQQLWCLEIYLYFTRPQYFTLKLCFRHYIYLNKTQKTFYQLYFVVINFQEEQLYPKVACSKQRVTIKTPIKM